MKFIKKMSSMLLMLAVMLSVFSVTFTASAEEQEMSAEFSEFLTDGKLVLNYAKPESKDSETAMLIADNFYDITGNLWFDFEGMPDDMSKVNLHYDNGHETHVVDVVWNYNEEVLKASQELLERFSKNAYYLTDLEVVNFLIKHPDVEAEYGEGIEVANYCGEIKKVLNGTNFYIKVDIRKGDGSPFHSLRGGITKLYYRDTLYSFLSDEIDIVSNRIIYVPENTADTPSALLEAAQKRIDDYIGKNKVNLSYNEKTISQYYTDEIQYFEAQKSSIQQEIDALNAIIAQEEAKSPELRDDNLISDTNWQIMLRSQDLRRVNSEIEYNNEQYNNGDYKIEFLKDATGDFMFEMQIPSTEALYNFIIVKDDLKLSTPTFTSTDVITDVSASTDSPEVPLDAIIWVEKVTGGKEHDHIHTAIGNTDTEMFDIQIRPGNRKEYISKLKNGKFQVKIPVPERFNGKNLMVYYVEENGKVNEHIVTVESGYAIFETNHFSIYTLAAVSNDTPITPENPDAPNNPDSNVTTPDTGDSSNVVLWLTLFVLSGGCLIVTIGIKKRKTF